MRGMTMSVSTIWIGCSSSSASAASPLSASRQEKPRDSPTVMQRRRMLCSSSTINNRMRKVSVMTQPSTHGLLDHGDKVLDPKWLFHAGRAGTEQRGCGCLVGHVAGDKDEPAGQFRAVDSKPGMDLGAIDASGHAHVRDHPVKIAFLEQPQSLGAGLGAHDGIAVAFEGGADKGQHGRFIFNQEHRRGKGNCFCLLHFGCTPATAPKDASSLVAGRRTVKVAPSESRLL